MRLCVCARACASLPTCVFLLIFMHSFTRLSPLIPAPNPHTNLLLFFLFSFLFSLFFSSFFFFFFNKVNNEMKLQIYSHHLNESSIAHKMNIKTEILFCFRDSAPDCSGSVWVLVLAQYIYIYMYVSLAENDLNGFTRCRSWDRTKRVRCFGGSVRRWPSGSIGWELTNQSLGAPADIEIDCVSVSPPHSITGVKGFQVDLHPDQLYVAAFCGH